MESNQDNSIIPIFSGGVDSTTMLWYLNDSGYKFSEVISFNYGQRHSIEINHAKNVLKRFSEEFNLKISHKIIDIQNIGNLIARGSITGTEKMPHDTYDSKNQRVTVVPNRNMIFISIAAGRAVTIGAKNVGYAAHASDYSVYPDCRPEFIDKMDEVLKLGNLWDPVGLIAPFQHKSKIDIVRVGNELNVPYELTWSCYEGKILPCLQCGTCIERTESFYKNELKDPALSEELWIKALIYLKQYSS